MDLLFYLRVVRKGWFIILLCALAGTGAAVFATSRATPIYEASTKLYISGRPAGDAQDALANGMLSQQRIASYADFVTTTPVVEAAYRSAGLSSKTAAVSAVPLPNTLVLVVTVRDSDPRRAMALANAFGRVVPDVIKRTEQPDSGAPSPIQASVSQPAVAPSAPVSPRPKLDTLLGLALGLLLGAGAALVREALDNSVKSAEDLSGCAPGLAVLGSVSFDADGQKNRLVSAARPRSAGAEAFRQLRTSLQFAEVDTQLRSFIISSALPDEGKSTVSANLAIALAQAGQRVVLVEADLRRPSLAEYMGFERAVGLTDVLIGRVPLADALQEFGATPGLAILASGPVPPNPSELLGSQAMNDLVRTLEGQADTVIFDTPPLLPVTDAVVLARHTTGAVLVVRVDRTTREQVRRALQALEAVGVTAIGAVLNFVRAASSDSYSYSYVAREDLPLLGSTGPELDPAGEVQGRPDKAATGDLGGRAAALRVSPTSRDESREQLSGGDGQRGDRQGDLLGTRARK